MFGVSPVTATIGAEVTDIDLGEDLGPCRRIMNRVTIAGDRPV
jgi:hypothetical protein